MTWSARAVAGWAVGTCLVSWGLSACLSPTLPLPPPGYPSVAVVNADGKSVRIEGDGAIANFTVYAYNEELGVNQGAVTAADSQGHYVLDPVPVNLTVHHTNQVRIWQTVGMDMSDPIYAYVPFGVAFGAPPADDAGERTTSEAGPRDAGASDSAE